MTDRGGAAEAARVCPFVALDDDRDRRLDHPDHRHRCFAEGRPEPRALAHQEAFCLSPSFPGCPVFQDWARREAARPTRAGAVPVAGSASAADRTPDRTPDRIPDRSPGTPEDAILAAGAGAAAGAAATAGPVGTGGAADVPAGPWDGWTSDPEDEKAGVPPIPPRRSRRDWAAPPRWGGPGSPEDRVPDDAAAGRASDPADASRPGDAPPPGFLADREGSSPDGPPQATGAAAAAVLGAEAANTGRGSGARRPPIPEPEYEDVEDEYAAPTDRPAPRRSIAAGRLRDSQHAEHPPWERPRRSEAYPALKSPMSLPRLGPLGAALVVLVIAALALFLVVPALLIPGANTGGGGPGASASASASASSAASAAPATPAVPTPQVYVIKQGDTLSKIAKKFGISVDELLAANTTTITDPNKIGLGQQIIIPVPGASVEASPVASPSPSA